jgi:hypothetical protein
MWIVFRYVNTPFLHLDKYVYAVVEDADILEYQSSMVDALGGTVVPIRTYVDYLQEFFAADDGTRFYVRKYVTTRRKEKKFPSGPMGSDRASASQSPVWVLQNPCNTAQ